jgi:hypothetical protein
MRVAPGNGSFSPGRPIAIISPIGRSTSASCSSSVVKPEPRTLNDVEASDWNDRKYRTVCGEVSGGAGDTVNSRFCRDPAAAKMKQQAGDHHQRTEECKRIVSVGTAEDEINETAENDECNPKPFEGSAGSRHRVLPPQVEVRNIEPH